MAFLDAGIGSRLLLILLLSGVWMQAPGQSPPPGEYQLKAAFIYNFAKFVEWPAQTFKDSGEPLIVCIFGQNPFGDTLQETLSRKTIGGRALVVRRVSNAQQASGCQILFVNFSETQRFRSISQDLKPSGVLTVGEIPGFASEGGIVNFKLEDGKVRFEVNVEAADRARLRISSKLLSLAQIVKK